MPHPNSLLATCSQEKVASFLSVLAERTVMTGCEHGAGGTAISFELPLTRTDMADYLGLTVETVSRQVTQLKSIGAIELIDNRQVVAS